MPLNAAQIQGGKAVPASFSRYHTPKEAVALLAEHGVIISSDTIRDRCNLPAEHPGHIRRALGFTGRYYISENELLRILGASEGAP